MSGENKVMKATKHTLQGFDKSEGCTEMRGGGTTASLVSLIGPWPAQVAPEDSVEGLGTKIIDKTITDPAVAGSLVGTVPKGCQILSTQMIIKQAGAVTGTSATLSVGTDADPDKYCTIGAPTQADSLAKNAKGSQLNDLDSAILAADEDVQVFPAATGGATAGNSVTGAIVRVVVTYQEMQALKNYA